MNIRAFYRATKVENAQAPYDTIHLKVFYPGQISEGEINRTYAQALYLVKANAI